MSAIILAMANRLLIVDATGLLFRAYYSISPLTAPDGTPVNAVYGLLRMMLKLFRELQPHASAFVFDAGKSTFRNELFVDYKAQRAEPPDDLKPQFALAIETTQCAKVPVFVQPGYEADDIIATITSQAHDHEVAVSIFTSDKDILQLLDSSVEVVMPLRQGKLAHHTAESLEAELGFPVARYIDYKALRGDPSDNIPGVKGIGEKTAARLVRDYGKLEQLYANLDLVKPDRVRRQLQESQQEVFLYRELVALRHDVPISYDFAERTLPDFSSQAFQKRITELGFKRIGEDAAEMGDLEANRL